jgi:glucose 1-dehydrogenase
MDDVPDGRGVLVEVLLRAGVDGTDKEINDAEHGDPLRATTSW